MIVPGGSLALIGGHVIDGEHLERDVSQGEGGEVPVDPAAVRCWQRGAEGAYRTGIACWQSQQPSHTRDRGGGSLLARTQANFGWLAW
jgi:hypothetical protein